MLGMASSSLRSLPRLLSTAQSKARPILRKLLSARLLIQKRTGRRSKTPPPLLPRTHKQRNGAASSGLHQPPLDQHHQQHDQRPYHQQQQQQQRQQQHHGLSQFSPQPGMVSVMLDSEDLDFELDPVGTQGHTSSSTALPVLPVLGEMLLSHCQSGCSRVLNSYRSLRGLKGSSSGSSSRAGAASIAVAQEMMEYVQARLRGQGSEKQRHVPQDRRDDSGGRGGQDQGDDGSDDVAVTFTFPAHGYGDEKDVHAADQNC
ncbi:MAG: hypothetical protein WDW38_009881 [Sanguina aurantia]